MPRVLNLGTGLEHDVPDGHWSLTSARYRVLPIPTPEPEREPVVKPAKRKGKGKPKSE